MHNPEDLENPEGAPSLSRRHLPRQGGDFDLQQSLIQLSTTEVKRRPPTNIRHSRPPKRRGEEAELVFMRKAIAEGFSIAKPWGDSERYDFILDNGHRLWRVQVRSTDYEVHNGFAVHAYVRINRKSVKLTARDVDVIVAYLVPRDLWYVVPIEACTCKNLWFYPGKSIKGSKFEKYREAWDYMRGADNSAEPERQPG